MADQLVERYLVEDEGLHRLSLAVGVSAVLLATLFGVPIGLLAGYAGGPLDLGLMWVMDLILAFPGLLLAIAIASALGPGPAHAALAIGLVGVPPMARLVRATALSASTAPYVEAARALGSSLPHLLTRHLLPAVAGVIGLLVSAAYPLLTNIRRPTSRRFTTSTMPR